jgi:hypothetical protein
MAAAALCGLSGLTATFSVGFRLADAMPAETPALLPALVAAVISAANLCALALLASPLEREDPAAMSLRGIAAIAPGLLAGFAWAPSGSVAAISGLLLAGVATAAACIGWWALSGSAPAASSADESIAHDSSPETADPVPISIPVEGVAEAERSGEPVAAGDNVSLQITRRGDSADESIEIVARLVFAPGERQSSLHLPISPPLASLPVVECEPLDESDIELQVGAAYPYGIRIDAKRKPPFQEGVAVAIGVQVHADAVRKAA